MTPLAGKFVGRAQRAVISPVILLSVGLCVLLGIVIMTYILAERSREYFDAAIATRDHRTAAVELRNALLAAESSHRGFIFSGNEVYLAPFDTAQSQALRWLKALERTAPSNPNADPLIMHLRTLCSEMLADMATIIALKRERRDADVMALFRTNRGKAKMDEANVFFTGLILAADDQLTEGIAEQRANSSWLRLVTVVGGMVIVAVVGFATSSVFKKARELAFAHSDLAALNEGLEAKVAARTADLAQASEEIQRFAYIVTHDLRAPLVNIMGFTSELEAGVKTLFAAISQVGVDGGLPDDKQQKARVAAEEDLPEAIHFIRSSTRKMDDLIKAILKLAREGRRSLRFETVDLADAIASAAASVQHQIKSDGGAVDFSIDVPHVVIDRLALDQVVGNLLDNAVKYRSSERPLAISIRAHRTDGERFVLEMEDNGRGIDPRDMTRIFDPFRRAGVRDQPGEGIGLAVVKALVRRLQGTITARSVLDRGTTFTLEIPLIQPDPERAS